MIKTTEFRHHKLIVTQLFNSTVFTFDNGRQYFLNKAGLHLHDYANHITIIGRPNPDEVDLRSIFYLPSGMTFEMWLSECKIMANVCAVLNIVDFPAKHTMIRLQRLA